MDVNKHQEPIHGLFQDVYDGKAFGRRIACHYPPQCGKSTISLAGVLWLCLMMPGIKIGYLTYGATLAREKERDFRSFARAANFHICDKPQTYREQPNQIQVTARSYRFANGSSIFWTYQGSSATGLGIDLWILDDVYTSPKEARSPTERANIEEFVTSCVFSRTRKGGTQIVYHFNTRFGPRDLTYYLEKHKRFQRWVFPAINDNGESIWPEQFPVSHYQQEQRDDPAGFPCIYQGNPRADEQALFHSPRKNPETGQWDIGHYDPRTLPKDLQYAIGIDLAYTKKKQGDFNSVALLGKDRASGITYLISLYRAQMPATALALHLKHHYQEVYNLPFQFVGAGPEVGIVDFLRAPPYSLRINFKTTQEDKYSRAQPLTAAWNQGKFRVPDPAIHADWDVHGQTIHWVPILLSEFEAFTGWDDDSDDQVDSCSVAYNSLNKSNGFGFRACPDHLLLV